MALPQSLLDAVEQHGCFSGTYNEWGRVHHCGHPTKPPDVALVLSCTDCYGFKLSVPASLVPNLNGSQLAHEASQHVRRHRGFALSFGGYHTGGFWLSGAYYDACGLFLLDGHNSRQMGSDLDLLMMAFRGGVVAALDPKMLDPQQYTTETIYLDEGYPLAPVTSRQDLLQLPQVHQQRPKSTRGHCRKLTLATFLPLAAPAPAPAPTTTIPVATPIIVTLPVATKPAAPSGVSSSGTQAAAASGRKLSLGSICPKCHAEVRERPLLNGTYVGCLC